MIAFSGSTTRKYTTALTLTETLSREITSCGGTSMRHDAQVDPHHLLHAGNDDDQARPLDLPEAAEQEDDAALVLAQDPDRSDDQDERAAAASGPKPSCKSIMAGHSGTLMIRCG